MRHVKSLVLQVRTRQEKQLDSDQDAILKQKNKEIIKAAYYHE